MKHDYFSSLKRNQSGAAVIEFALTLPLLLILFFGFYELSRYIIAIQKVNNATYTLADVITRFPPIDQGIPASAQPDGVLTRTELQTLLTNPASGALETLLAPFDVGGVNNAGVIVTSINRPPGDDVIVNWRVVESGGAFGEADSKITGAAGDIAGFNTELSAIIVAQPLFVGENIIGVEVFYRYTTLFDNAFTALGISPVVIRGQAFFSPRFGSLTDIDP